MNVGWRNKKRCADICDEECVIALAGNPNVGKSTVFNALTGLRQHTGNWPGKTVESACGTCSYKKRRYNIVDLPGTYSLLPHSQEEVIARDYICSNNADVVVVVCDATCIERNLNLVLQTLEITSRVVVCVNLMDEAKKKNVNINLEELSKRLGCPTVGCTARSKKGLSELMNNVDSLCRQRQKNSARRIEYLSAVELSMAPIIDALTQLGCDERLKRWIATRLLCGDDSALKFMNSGKKDEQEAGILSNEELSVAVQRGFELLYENGVASDCVEDVIASCVVNQASDIAKQVVSADVDMCYKRDRRIDKVLTSKKTGIPIMLAMLALIFWITITGANYPSQLLSQGFTYIGNGLTDFMGWIGAPAWLSGVLIDGMYKVLAWVVAVMLPPMAIFFPLFTLLEDAGYLPRVAFNLDKYFKRCCACGKQALTMCMGFGCNAAAVVGCKIIDSPRERIIAMLTNVFVPCNGRFPTMIALISMFFGSLAVGFVDSVVSALILTGVIVFGIFMTFAMSKFLSKTFLKGVPSSFTLELPPYRRPQFGKVIVRSLLDRTLFVLARAVIIAAPAGVVIYVMANVQVDGVSVLMHCANFLDPFANVFGLDGIILMAFILGFPANEIVVPIIIMAYLSSGTLTELSSLVELKALLVQNGWTWLTALCTLLFTLMHFPCSTTCLSIKKETNSFKWTALAFALPTIVGLLVCFVVANAVRIFGLV